MPPFIPVVMLLVFLILWALRKREEVVRAQIKASPAAVSESTVLYGSLTVGDFLVSASYPQLVARASDLTKGEVENLTRSAKAISKIHSFAGGGRLFINSGHRGPALTAALGGSKSQHGHPGGFAADIRIQGWSNDQLQGLVWSMHQAGELDELDQSITYDFTNHLHVGFSTREKGQFLRAIKVRNDEGALETDYVRWTP